MDIGEKLLIALISASGFWVLLQYLVQRFFESKAKEKQKKQEEAEAIRQKQMDEIHTAIIDIKEELSANKDLTLCLGRDRVNDLCNKFTEIGYIPKEDNISFILIGRSYCANGNTEVRTKFEWCVENLPVK